MLNKTCDLFISELGSNAPVPGGGSAAALVGAVGIALGTMVGEQVKKRTQSMRKRYSSLSADPVF